MRDKWLVYAFIFILGWNFGKLLMGNKAYNLGLKAGKFVKGLINEKHR